MVTLHSPNDAAKSKVCEHSFALLRGAGVNLETSAWRVRSRWDSDCFLDCPLHSPGAPFGILITKKMEARKVPAVKVAPQELVDYSVSSSSGTTLSYFGYEFDVPWNANFKQKVGKGLVEVQFESGQNVIFIVPENQSGLLTESWRTLSKHG